MFIYGQALQRCTSKYVFVRVERLFIILLVVQNVLPTAQCRLPIAYCLLPIACCPLQVVHCLLQVAYCILHSAYAIAPIAYCLVPYCLLRSPENIRLFQTPHCLHTMPPIRSRTSTTHTDHSKYLKSNSNSYKNTS